MKRWTLWGRRLGIAGSVLLGTLITAAHQVLALTDEQVAQRLQSVPVFAITTPEGAPLVNTISRDGQQIAVTEVFMSPEDAEEFLQGLQQANPELAGQVSIKPLSLGEIFRLIAEAPEDANVPRFSLVPLEDQVQAAQSLLQQRGESTEGFQGVPLFYAESTQAGGGYLTITQGEQQVIPLYFYQQDIQSLLTRVSQQNPALANNMQVQVTTLEALISVLRSEEDPALNNIFLVPPTASLEYIQQEFGGEAPAANPGQ